MRGLAILLGLWGFPAAAVTCNDMTFEGISFTACIVDPATEDLRLFLRGTDGEIYGSFGALGQAMPGKTLTFAMNAGMYHDDRAPVGYYVEDGVEERSVVSNPGPGNFGLLPNGVFCIGDGVANVQETLAFVQGGQTCRHATQSGPMLVIDGALHPRFLPDSTSRYVRNGVGTTAAGDKAVFVISNQTVTFHEFARFFRDGLGLPNALYFDGNISRLYAPGLNRADGGLRMGPIVGVVEPVDGSGTGG